MILPCPKCQTDVPEGATHCPKCGAGLATMILGNKRGLTKTLIGKAIELRTQIPWARASAVVLLDDPQRPGKKKVRTGARNAFVVLVLANLAGAIYLFTRPHEAAPVFIVTTPETSVAALDAPEATKPEAAKPEAAKPEAAKPEATKPEAAKPEATRPATPRPEAPKPSPPAAPPPTPKVAAAAPPPAKKPAETKAAPKPGTLVVTAISQGRAVTEARVRANGVDLGNTPVSAPMQPGKYTLKIEKAGFKSEKVTEVEVLPGKKSTVKVELKK